MSKNSSKQRIATLENWLVGKKKTTKPKKISHITNDIPRYIKGMKR
jgi:hypothetical protein